jgi:hypothetical protein
MSDTYKEKEMDEVEKKARELLAAECERQLMPGAAEQVRRGEQDNGPSIRAIVAALTASQQPQGVMENVSDELLVLAADFETCIPFLPRVGAQNIGSRVKQLRRIALGIAAPPAAAVPDGLLDELRDVALESDGSSGARSAIRVAFDEAEKRIAPAPGVSND